MFTWVYKYRYWDDERQENAVSEDAFTLEAIRSGLGTPILETGVKVRHDDLDDSGRFRRYVPETPATPAVPPTPAKEI